MPSSSTTLLDRFMRQHRSRVDAALDRWLPKVEIQPSVLHEAMRYAVLDGGKRLRPMLVYAAGEALRAEDRVLDGPACAVELVHAYSLIHDDLPCMDNDELRRGKPTCHIAFGEATALLAGDSLQTLAFQILARDSHMTTNSSARLQMIGALAQAVGSRGMAGGQAIDLAAVGQDLNLLQLENMHIRKTGALIRASVTLGALSALEPDDAALYCLDHYAKCVGLAFQIRDDILDVEGDTETLGKSQGADKARNKPTYPSLLGVGASRAKAMELYQEAEASLSQLDEHAEILRELARYTVERIR
jgi:geranylgeranyl diphosphate synthase type II